MKKLLLFFYLLPGFCFAQEKLPTRYFELGLGGNSYKGDLSANYKNYAGSMNASMVNNFGKRLSGSFNFQWGSVIAQNSNYFYDDNSNPQPTPNKFAKTTFLSLHYGLRVALFRKKGVTCYVGQGIGFFRFLPKDQDNISLQTQLSTRKENEVYSNLAFYFPTVFGVNYVLKQGYGVGTQIGWMNTSTDYLDNISLWSSNTKNDNVFCFKVSFITPLSFKEKKKAQSTTKPAQAPAKPTE